MVPLSRTLRQRLFWLCLALFVFGTPVLIMYAKGYRFDTALSLVKTGGIYVHSDVTNASIYLDDTYREQNSMLWRNFFLEELEPGTMYVVRVDKAGYQSWVKKLPVYADLVTEARVLMLPQRFTWTTVSATTTVAVSGGGTSATGTVRAVANPEYADLMELFTKSDEQFVVSIATTTYTTVRGKRVATTTTEEVIRFPDWMQDVASSSGLSKSGVSLVREREGVVAWLTNGDVYARWAHIGDPPPYFFCAAVCMQQTIIEWREPIKYYDFIPNRDDAILVASDRGIFAVELDGRSDRNIQLIAEGVHLSFRIERNGTLVVRDGDIFRTTKLDRIANP